MSRILISGDTHGERNILSAERTALEHECDSMILCGDIWSIDMPRELPTHMIAGNHERFDLWESMLRIPEIVPKNVIMHDYWDRFDIDGVSFGAIGKINAHSHAHLASEIRWLYDALGPKPDIWMEEKPTAEVEELFNNIDILITHDAPYPMELPRYDSWEQDWTVETCGSSYLADIIRAVHPRITFSGHMHRQYIRQIDNTRAITLDQVQGANPQNCFAIIENGRLQKLL